MVMSQAYGEQNGTKVFYSPHVFEPGGIIAHGKVALARTGGV